MIQILGGVMTKPRLQNIAVANQVSCLVILPSDLCNGIFAHCMIWIYGNPSSVQGLL
jgi:hypothetical protein